jgi:hypothetical protein
MTKYSLAASASLCAALCAMLPCAVAQSPAHQHAMPKLEASAAVASLDYPATGIWASYRKFSDPPLANWRQSNALVEQIGGWMAIAKEVHGGMANELDAAKDKK